MTSVSKLKGNPKNPRTISKEKLVMLKKSLAEFGDLSGVIRNVETDQLVGGHQRVSLFKEKDAKVIIERRFKNPTKTGTVAEGYIEFEGERFIYREVSWDETKEKAAIIAANKAAGEFELGVLGELFREIDDLGFDLDLTMFDGTERSGFFVLPENFEPGTEEDQGKLDEKKKQICPHCGEAFLVGGRV